MQTALPAKEAIHYRGQWVTFSRDMKWLNGHGQTPEEALESAREAGFENDAFLLFMSDRWLGPEKN